MEPTTLTQAAANLSLAAAAKDVPTVALFIDSGVVCAAVRNSEEQARGLAVSVTAKVSGVSFKLFQLRRYSEESLVKVLSNHMSVQEARYAAFLKSIEDGCDDGDTPPSPSPAERKEAAAQHNREQEQAWWDQLNKTADPPLPPPEVGSTVLVGDAETFGGETYYGYLPCEYTSELKATVVAVQPLGLPVSDIYMLTLLGVGISHSGEMCPSETDTTLAGVCFRVVFNSRLPHKVGFVEPGVRDKVHCMVQSAQEAKFSYTLASNSPKRKAEGEALVD